MFRKVTTKITLNGRINPVFVPIDKKRRHNEKYVVFPFPYSTCGSFL